ncbi:MAG TPA: hypothetical protein VMV52_10665 [Candidatus Nanopelagicaceae bacterium]|nr:hypothetical protein [Candidatus Nanopelagicaceae bacterium]
MGGWGWNDTAGTSWWIMGGMMIFWIAVIGIGIWFVVRLTDRRGEQQLRTESPRSILDRRFASGELSAEQYAEARRLLELQTLPRQ